MGRRLSIHRPTAKVRGVDRRLRALDRWADGFAGYEPYVDERYMNHKIPVLDRLVNPPTTTAAIQEKALASLLKAADYLSRSPVKEQVPYYRACVLMGLPDMFHSEVTAYYDEDYYRSFWRSDQMLDPKVLTESFDVTIPDGFEVCGYIVPFEVDFDDIKGVRTDEEGRYWIDEERWVIGQKP